MKDKKIVLLGGNGSSTNIVFNYLNDNFGIYVAIIESPQSQKKIIFRRMKKLGFFIVVGQLIFQIFAVPLLFFFSRKRRKEIINYNSLETKSIPPEKKLIVPSVNSIQTIEVLKEINPDLIIVNGTRIISKKVLESIQCKFINTHAGITPKYRGVHGAYWALVKKDLKNCGVTVHFVDKGIDTGGVIYQDIIEPTQKDNFTTYPLLQLSKGLKLLSNAITDYFNNSLTIKKVELESHLWYHPSIFQYLYNRVIHDIK